MKFSNYHWRILYMFCECCKQELMSVCLFVFMGSWMSGVTLLHNLIWPADDNTQSSLCCVPFVNLIHKQLCKWRFWQNNLISSWRCLENLMRKIIKEWIFMYIAHKETRTEIECTEVKSCYYSEELHQF